MSFISYIKETRGEFTHVNWPTRRQTIIFTIAVIVISVGIAYVLGAFDKIYALGLTKVLELR